MQKHLHIGIRELCEKMLPWGSLDTRRSAFRVIESVRLHKELQKKGGAVYTAELPVCADFVSGDFTVTLSGRADGVIQTEDGYVVEEIKCVNVPVKSLEPGFCPTHLAQAMCYAYIYGTEHSLESITVRLTYCDISTEETVSFDYPYEVSSLKDFTENLLLEFTQIEAEKLARRAEFNSSAKRLAFPYGDYRDGQRLLAEHVLEAVCTKKKLFAEAPTGTGKTIAALFPAIKAMGAGYGSKIFYFTSKTTIAKAAADTFGLLQSGGLKGSAIVISARERICRCSPETCEPSVCHLADCCFERINEATLDAVRNETFFDREVIDRYADKHRVCPFELSLSVSEWCELVICDYNYLFDPNAYFRRYFSEYGDYIFLIDEAHNLGDRAREMYTHSVKSSDIEQLISSLSSEDKILFPKALEVLEYMKTADKLVETVRRKEGEIGTFVSEKQFGILNRRLTELVNAFDLYFDRHKGSERRYGELYFEIKNHLKIAEYYSDKYVSTIDVKNGEYTFRELCIDPSDVINTRASLGRGAVFFSATLSPFDYYKSILGGSENDLYLTLPSPFPKENLCLCSTYKFSTRLDDRKATNTALAKLLNTFVSAKDGNYIVFFPSYKYMSAVHSEYKRLYPDARTIIQKSSMTSDERLEFISCFENPAAISKTQEKSPDVTEEMSERDAVLAELLGTSLKRGASLFGNMGKPVSARENTSESSTNSLLAFAVLGGVFAEGVDYAGERLIGCAIVGVGLPGINDESNIILEHYNKKSCDENMPGYDFAYRIPGMIKVLQAAGRVIRSENDRGAVLLIDDRFASPEYTRLFPSHWKHIKYVGNDAALRELLRRFYCE